MVDYGRDLKCVTGLDRMMREIDGSDPRLVGESIARAWTTATGALAHAPNDGVDVNQLENGSFDRRVGLKQWQTRLYNQAMRDERVLSCTVELTYDSASTTLTIKGAGVTANGPFSLVQSVANVRSLSRPNV